MQDINNMNIHDFYGILEFAKMKENKRTGHAVPLKQSQKEMIKITKEKEMNKNG